jgi:hypothetical protein
VLYKLSGVEDALLLNELRSVLLIMGVPLFTELPLMRILGNLKPHTDRLCGGLQSAEPSRNFAGTNDGTTAAIAPLHAPAGAGAPPAPLLSRLSVL